MATLSPVQTPYFTLAESNANEGEQRIFELFFCKKIPHSRRVEYVMDGSMDHSVSESVSETCMYVTPIRSDLL